jgi:hypothetical protein
MSTAGRLKVSTFTVRATERQSARWKQATEAYGHASVGTWLAEAADRHLDALQRAGKPLPLAWGKGRFRVRLEDGRELELDGWMARPFGIFRGTAAGPGYHGCHLYTPTYMPTLRLLGTFRTSRHCKEFASELARLWGEMGRKRTGEDPGPVLERFQRENV